MRDTCRPTMRYDLPRPAQCTDVPLQHERRCTDRPTTIHVVGL